MSLELREFRKLAASVQIGCRRLHRCRVGKSWYWPMIVVVMIAICCQVARSITRIRADEALLDAVKRDNAFAVTSALGRGANPNCLGHIGLQSSVWHRQSTWPVVCFSPPTRIEPALLLAMEGDGCGTTFSDRFVLVRLLVGAGANPNVTDYRGMTTLNYAAVTGSVDDATYLLRHGADINHQDTHGNTPLMNACMRGRDQMANALINAGASTDLMTQSGDTAMSITIDRLRASRWEEQASLQTVISVLQKANNKIHPSAK